ncbi:unnamed protein product [Closterium sp. Naga37s-1]|nr:unnamed protein product [Closterium sp. Naga37s-1]
MLREVGPRQAEPREAESRESRIKARVVSGKATSASGSGHNSGVGINGGERAAIRGEIRGVQEERVDGREEVTLGSITMAVADVNSDPTILPRQRIRLITGNISASTPSMLSQLAGFSPSSPSRSSPSAPAAMATVQQRPVAIIGPGTSDQAALISPLATATQTPLVSAAATDVQLTVGGARPFFMRTIPNDGVDMQAIAALLLRYKWRQFVAVYTDNRFGRNGITALMTYLLEKKASYVHIAQRVPVKSTWTSDDVAQALAASKAVDSSVYVLHASSTMSALILDTASKLGMIGKNYVWIASEGAAQANTSTLQSAEGLIITASYHPPSQRLSAFKQRWKQLSDQQFPGAAEEDPKTYSLAAYDAVYLVSLALHSLLQHTSSSSSSSSSSGSTSSTSSNGSSSSTGAHFFAMSAVASNSALILPVAGQGAEAGGGLVPLLQNLQRNPVGSALRRAILNTTFEGLTGRVSLNPHGDLQADATEVLNVVNATAMRVGFWTPAWQLTPSLKQPSKNQQEALNIVFPGGVTQVPIGAFPKTKLRLAVPNKVVYKQFVNISKGEGNGRFSGFCIDVFHAAVAMLPYPLDFEFVQYGQDNVSPSYTELVLAVAAKTYDGAIGDITVTETRNRAAFFTYPIFPSGLGIMGYAVENSSPWLAFQPFTVSMWGVTMALCLLAGLITSFLEQQSNEAFRGKLHQCLQNAAWFGLQTLYAILEYPVRTSLARLFVIVFLIIGFLIVTMYTANLTSIVTVNRLKPSAMDIGSAASTSSPIGYQLGSFINAYLLQMGIPANRLVALNNEDEYAEALTSGRVGVIVDESPYLQLFSLDFCDVALAPQPFSLLNLAFAFPKRSQLGLDTLQAIMQLSMSGHLQQLHQPFFNAHQYPPPPLFPLPPPHPTHSVPFPQAFPKGSQLGLDVSQAIVQLTMSGELQKLREKHFSGINGSCTQPSSSSSDSSSYGISSSSSSGISSLAADSAVQLSMQKFLGLYIIFGSVSLGCCLLYVLLLIHRGYRASRYGRGSRYGQKFADWHRHPNPSTP